MFNGRIVTIILILFFNLFSAACFATSLGNSSYPATFKNITFLPVVFNPGNTILNHGERRQVLLPIHTVASVITATGQAVEFCDITIDTSHRHHPQVVLRPIENPDYYWCAQVFDEIYLYKLIEI